MLKKIFVVCILLSVLGLNTGAICGDPDQEVIAGISWDKTSHDFGTIHEGEIVETNYTVFNNRKDTLVIENVQGSCGCVAYNWPHEPILPGAKGVFKISFNAGGKSGNQMKSVAVYTNKGLFSLSLNAYIVKK